MEHLWTPWRMKYIQEHHDYEGCIFCLALDVKDGEANLIFHRGENVYCILNRYPYTSGHIMVIPYAHEDCLQSLNEATQAEMMALVSKAVEVLQDVYTPEGFNVGLNLGKVAGAGLADHLHMHIVPRWGGDTNFMSAIGQTRVLPETLSESYHRIKSAWVKQVKESK